MLGTWIAAMLLCSAPGAEAPKNVDSEPQLRDLRSQLHALEQVTARAGTQTAQPVAGLRDPFAANGDTQVHSPECSDAEQANGDRSVRCRARLQTPFS